MNFIRRNLLLLLFSFMHCFVFANDDNIVFEQITNESGRSLGYITGIVQDETGFMWFATRNGLYRYNGYSYKLFKSKANDSLSIPWNDITHLYLDNEQYLWMRHFDGLAPFKNECTYHGFESIVNKSYDMEVQIKQDILGNYWVGPTGKGIDLYLPEQDSTIHFAKPLKTYMPEAWKYFDSVLTKNTVIATINNPANNSDTSVNFEIKNDGFYLIGSSGEIDRRGKYDFGSLLKNGTLIWELSKDKCMWAGGADKNVYQAEPIFLKSGNYTINFKSDLSHCCAEWDGKAPNKISTCGISLVAISEKQSKHILLTCLSAHKSSTYLESNNVKDILIDNTGAFWALTDKGLEKYNYKTGRFSHYDIPFKDLLGLDMRREYLKLYQDKDGIFWIGSEYGLIQYDLMWGRYEVFQNSASKKILTSNAIHTIFQDNDNNIWIGTNNGLNIYNKELRTIQKITRNNRNRLYNDNIVQIFEDKSGNIWVATFEGLNRLIKNPFNYIDLKFVANNQYPVKYDHSANIWYALGNKVSKYSRSLSKISNFTLPNKIFNISDFTGEYEYDIYDMELANDNNIWLATANKVSRFNIQSEKVDLLNSIPAIIVGNDSLKNVVKQLQIDLSGKIYAFCPNGVYTFNPKKRKQTLFTSFDQTYDFIEDVDMNFFKYCIQDKKGKIWIRTAAGIYIFSPNLNKVTLVYEFSDDIRYGPLNAGTMAEDKFGNIWLATLPEIVKINGENLKSQTWTIDKESDWGKADIKILNETAWIYSTNGLYNFNFESKEFKYFSQENNGIVSDNINGVVLDKLGYLWITSLKGLSKLDINEETCENFFRPSDFTSHEFIGNHPEFKMPDNEFMLFTTRGLVNFYPDSINNRIPEIVIDKFTIRGKEYELDSLIYKKNNIELTYNQNFLGFEFAVLDYTAPAKNRYKYIMEGLDEEWIFTDANNRSANYPGLSPGRYTFKVIGANNDKVWNEEGTYLNILISPPWYKTIVAYIIYLIIIVSSIWTFIKVREKQLREEKQILEQKVKERTAEIEEQKEELAKQNKEIEEAHQNITDSIHYAQRIQSAILPPVEKLCEVIDDYFILYRPRDIVSGDYYWITQRDDITIIVAADCTGHGVPGAFMSMLGIAFLNEIVNKEGIIEPNKILDRLRQQVIKQLHQTGKDGESKDGMDVSLYVIDHKSMKLKFSGAYNGLYIVRNEEMIQLKADRMPIGYYIKLDVDFSMKEIDLQKGDCIYNTSDGYPDQFGGPNGRKFMTKNFKQLLLDVHKKPMAEQREILDTRFDEWRGETDQIDDVIVIGVRV